MFDLSWGELLLVGAIALVVIGPRELPRVLRTVGQTLAKVRRMAGEFQSQFSAAMREAELDELRQTVKDVQETASRTMATQTGAAFKPLQAVRDEFHEVVKKTGLDKPTDAGSYSINPELEISLGQKADISTATISPAPVFTHGALADPVMPVDALPFSSIQKKRKSACLKKSGRVIIAAPRDAVKPLARQPKGAARLYKKTKFSAFPARKRHSKPVLVAQNEQDNA